jgi:hypothetical protein
MNREQMIEKAAEALLAACGACDDAEGRADHVRDARTVLDAILPQVSTFEELEALDPRSLMLKDFDTYARAEDAASLVRAARYLGRDFLPVNPLTVVWQP